MLLQSKQSKFSTSICLAIDTLTSFTGLQSIKTHCSTFMSHSDNRCNVTLVMASDWNGMNSSCDRTQFFELGGTAMFSCGVTTHRFLFLFLTQNNTFCLCASYNYWPQSKAVSYSVLWKRSTVLWCRSRRIILIVLAETQSPGRRYCDLNFASLRFFVFFCSDYTPACPQ